MLVVGKIQLSRLGLFEQGVVQSYRAFEQDVERRLDRLPQAHGEGCAASRSFLI